MTDPSNLRGDSLSSFDDECVLEEFETAWRSQVAPPSIVDFVSRAVSMGLNEQDALLELVRIDLEYRWTSADIDPWTVEEYQRQFPQLRFCVELIEDELYWKRRRGELLDPIAQLQRFPRSVFSDDREFERWNQLVVSMATPSNDLLGPGNTLVHLRAGTTDEATVDSFIESSRVDARPVWTLQSSRFELVSLIGQGGFGTVWRAFDNQLQRHVAIKTLHESLACNAEHRETLLREARAVAKLDHPDLVTVYDCLDSQNQVHLVMQYIDGVDLDTWWKAQHGAGSNASEDALLVRLTQLLARVALAVHHAHLAGLIHCDLKPQNILVDAQHDPTVLDFGLAIGRLRQHELPERIVGTPAYMSPEQTWGDIHHLDGRADIWSLGVILYRLLSERMPFEGSTIQKVFEAIQTRSLTPLGQLRDNLPVRLVRICERCLSKRIEDRYATASELASELERFARESTEAHSVVDSSGCSVVGLPWTEPDLVGRDDCIARVTADIVERQKRLVTLTGVGGIGKTQTAAAVARRIAQVLSTEKTLITEVVWVNLATVTDEAHFASAVLAALNVTPQPNESSFDRVAQALLVRGRCLLVLDNFEQIARDSSRLVTQWLGQVESLRLLITSQVPLRVPGEVIHVLAPLVIGEANDAVELFVRRAKAARSSFDLTPSMRAEVIQICRLVDGNPLAIELAAARAGILGVSKLHQRLNDSFAVLKNTRSNHPARHQTLHDVVQWSYDLLSSSQQSAFLVLAIWPAALSIGTAEWLIADCGDDPLDLLDELTQRNLLRLQESQGDSFISGSTVVQRFARESIGTAQGCRAAARLIDRVCVSILSDVEVVVDDQGTLHGEYGLSREDHSLESTYLATNLWAAKQWIEEHSAHDLNLDRVVAAVLMADRLAQDEWDSAVRIKRLSSCWSMSNGVNRIELSLRMAHAKRLAGQQNEAERLVREVIVGTDRLSKVELSPCNSVRRIKQIAAASRRLLAKMEFRHGESKRAIELLEAALVMLDQEGQSAPTFDVILELAEIYRRIGQTEIAGTWLQRGDQLLQSKRNVAFADEQTGDVKLLVRRARWSIEQGKVALQRGQIAQSRSLFEEAIGQLDLQRDTQDLQQALLGRAAAAAESGDFDAASQDYDRCESLSRRLGDLPTLAQAINNRALAFDDAGDSERCCATLENALEIYRQLGDSLGVAISLIAKAASILQLGNSAQALEILDSPQVRDVVPPNSIHHAILLGDRGTALNRLGRLEQAREMLEQSLASLANLGISSSADHMLYRIELASVLERLEEPAFGTIVAEINAVLADGPGQWARRKRLAVAIATFEQMVQS